MAITSSRTREQKRKKRGKITGGKWKGGGGSWEKGDSDREKERTERARGWTWWSETVGSHLAKGQTERVRGRPRGTGALRRRPLSDLAHAKHRQHGPRRYSERLKFGFYTGTLRHDCCDVPDRLEVQTNKQKKGISLTDERHLLIVNSGLGPSINVLRIQNFWDSVWIYVTDFNHTHKHKPQISRYNFLTV